MTPAAGPQAALTSKKGEALTDTALNFLAPDVCSVDPFEKLQ
jgi:hypothetical protein